MPTAVECGQSFPSAIALRSSEVHAGDSSSAVWSAVGCGVPPFGRRMHRFPQHQQPPHRMLSRFGSNEPEQVFLKQRIG